jgi:hypothetical protein
MDVESASFNRKSLFVGWVEIACRFIPIAFFRNSVIALPTGKVNVASGIIYSQGSWLFSVGKEGGQREIWNSGNQEKNR